MAHALEDLGVDIIEAGFAMASEGDFAAIATITQAIRKPRIASLARAKTEDIEMAARALQFADRARIHVFLASSDLHLEYKLKISRAEALDLCRRIGAPGALAGATMSSFRPRTRPARIAISWSRWCASPSKPAPPPSTCPTPWATPRPKSTAACFAEVRERIPAIDAAGHHPLLALPRRPGPGRGQLAGRHPERRAPGGVHHQRHRRARRQRGARRDCRRALCARRPLRRLDQHQARQALSHQPGAGPAHHLPPSPNKAIVGDNAFAHESGIHQHGMLANPLCYEIMTPRWWASPKTHLVLGKHSGRAALRTSAGAARLRAHPRRVAAHLLPLCRPGRPQEEHLRPGSGRPACPIRFAKSAANRYRNSINPNSGSEVAGRQENPRQSRRGALKNEAENSRYRRRRHRPRSHQRSRRGIAGGCSSSAVTRWNWITSASAAWPL